MRQLIRRQFRRTTLWLFFFVAVLLGIGFAHTGHRFVIAWLWLGAIGSVLTLRRRDLSTLVIVSIFGLLLGIWRGANYLDQLSAYQQLVKQNSVFTVTATNDAIYDTHKQLAFDAHDITLNDGRHVVGKVQVSGFGVNAVYQGDILQVEGKLYPGYGAYQGRLSFAKLTVTEHHPSLVGVVRQKFTAGVLTALPEPLGSFVMGLLVGQRATLPADIKENLLKVGLTHIIAVSGYNLTIILHASKRLLGKRSKRISTFLSLALIGVFLLLAGASASIVRAAIVSVLSIAASYYGRTFKPLNLIALAATITAWANPVYIWSDLSWYLSFLAFYGVMVLSPLVQARWPAGWHQSLIGAVALESICAEIMSLPFVLHIFGQMSLIGLPANVLVVTLVPLAMLLGLIAGLAGMLMGPFCGWFAWPAKIILTYMLDTAQVLSHLPHIFIENRSLSLAIMLGLYVLIALVTASLWRKTKSTRLGIITDIKQTTNRGLLA